MFSPGPPRIQGAFGPGKNAVLAGQRIYERGEGGIWIIR